jgi:hypothetical protein
VLYSQQAAPSKFSTLLTTTFGGEKSAELHQGFSPMKWTLPIVLGAALICISTITIVLSNAATQRAADALAAVTRWAEELHAQTTDAGVYVRHPGNQLPENDPWGTPLNVTYTQGGFAERLTVRSAGPDRTFYTQDDIVAQRSVVNLRGIGRGAKENVEEFAHYSARGIAKGAADGIKEIVQEALAGKKPGQQKAN